MSWQSYTDNLAAGKGRCTYAGIYGIQGGVWAESIANSQFKPSAEEVAAAIKAITSQDMNIMGTGLTMSGFKFTCLRMEPDILICQGKADNKDFSLVIALSSQACIIGFNPDPDCKTAQVREACEGIQVYLKNAGY